jgi:hypothetical protein
MKRVYTIEITKDAPYSDRFNRVWLEVGPEELFQDTGSNRFDWTFTVEGARRRARRMIDRNERILANTTERYEVTVRD